MNKLNLNTIEAVTEEMGANQLLDAVLGSQDAETLEKVVTSIMKENNLGD